ncbi:Glycoside hydrolase family 63 protein [Mycena chlorophos]|uniref:rRNA adenine N(6)-methyltransferase n=1 Tax=Mycena chlorophos TaxID=658473 RepID=A0A8H6SEV7_MYCCL|nr:Glycoside hydrolase family 63 protein [Mycena chlorophos]
MTGTSTSPRTTDSSSTAFLWQIQKARLMSQTHSFHLGLWTRHDWYAGPGQLTRALLALPRSRLKKLIVLENVPDYLQYLKPLEAMDDRISVVNLGGEAWSTYHALDSMGLLRDIKTTSWDEVHPQLQFVSHLTINVAGEQLLSQLLRSVPEQQWLFKYGRIPMSLLMSENLWNRVTGDSLTVRCKLSIIAAAVSSFRPAVPIAKLQPYAKHFHPIPSAHARKQKETKMTTGRKGNPFVAATFEPLQQQAIKPGMLDKWDFCLRHLYVHRAKPIKVALPYLAPNALSLLKGISEPDLPADVRIDPQTHVRNLTVAQWSILVKAFDEWPFAPEDLAVTDKLMIRDEKKG